MAITPWRDVISLREAPGDIVSLKNGMFLAVYWDKFAVHNADGSVRWDINLPSGSSYGAAAALANGNFVMTYFNGTMHVGDIYTPNGAKVNAAPIPLSESGGNLIGLEYDSLGRAGFVMGVGNHNPIAWDLNGNGVPQNTTGRPDADGDYAFTALKNGNYVAAYDEHLGYGSGKNGLKVQILSISGSVQKTIDIATNVNAAAPSVTTLKNGNFVVAWAEAVLAPVVGTPTRFHWRAQIFDKDGNPVSGVISPGNDDAYFSGVYNVAGGRVPGTMSVAAKGDGWAWGFSKLNTDAAGRDASDFYVFEYDAGGVREDITLFDSYAQDIMPQLNSISGDRFVITTKRPGLFIYDSERSITWIDPADATSGWGGHSQYAGSNYDDRLDGRSGNDTLYGGAGNDGLTGGAGADDLYGGDGIDYVLYDENSTTGVSIRLWDRTGVYNSEGDKLIDIENAHGTAGGDYMEGNAVANVMAGLWGNDVLKGLQSSDFLVGGGGDDVLDGGDDADELYGESQNDTLIGGKGADKLHGGSETDTASYEFAESAVVAFLDKALNTTGDQNGAGEAEGDTFVEIENITGSRHADVIGGNSGNNVLDGGANADHMFGGAGADTYVIDNVGDKAHDVSNFSDRDTLSIIDYLGGTYSITQAGGMNVEDMIARESAKNIKLIGDGIGNKITGNSFQNTLQGAGGDDTLDGGGGLYDNLEGGAGGDSYFIRSGSEFLNESDTTPGALDRVYVFNTVRSYTLTAGARIEEFRADTSHTGGLTLIGNEHRQTIIGSKGDDTLDGGTGDAMDTLQGGEGNDTYIVNRDIEKIVIDETGKDSADKILLRHAVPEFSIRSYGYIENLEAEDSAGAVRLIGNTYKNEITGNSHGNILDGDDDTIADTLIGKGGNDTYIFRRNADIIVEDEGASGGEDTIKLEGNTYWGSGLGSQELSLTKYTNVENIDASAIGDVADATGIVQGQLRLIGNSGNNNLKGGDALNTLSGGGGNDTLAGGKGNDVYVVDSSLRGTTTIEEKDGEGTDEVWVNGDYTLTSGAYVEILRGTNATANNIAGNERNNGITGNIGADVLDGGGGNDELKGGQGNDTYVVREGTTITEAAGEGTEDKILLRLASSPTETRSFTLADTIDVEIIELHDTMMETSVNITGNSKKQTISGGNKADTLDGGGGADLLQGGNGNDTYYVDDVGDVALDNGSETEDTIILKGSDWGTGTKKSYQMGAGIEILDGRIITSSAAGLEVFGNSGDNKITMGGGNDTLDGIGSDASLSGKDTLEGGAGNDTYRVDKNDVIKEAADNGYDKVEFSGDSYTLAAGLSIEELHALDNTGVSLTGNELANKIFGGDGADILIGYNRASGTVGGKDTLNGGDGADTYYIGGSADVMADVVEADAGDGDKVVLIDTNIGSYTLGANLEDLAAGDGTGEIELIGNELSNHITGNASKNTLTGGEAGVDWLDGVQGDDLYLVSNGTTTVSDSGTSQDDTIRLNTAAYGSSYSLENATGVEHLEATDAAGAVELIGTSGNNRISGNDYANILDGNGGQDTLTGGDGNDVYVIRTGTEVIIEDGGATGMDSEQDAVEVHMAEYTLSNELDGIEILKVGRDYTSDGTKGASIVGSAYSTTLIGGNYADTLDGGVDNGARHYEGGNGNDVYYLHHYGDKASVQDTVALDSGGDSDTAHIYSKNFSSKAALDAAIAYLRDDRKIENVIVDNAAPPAPSGTFNIREVDGEGVEVGELLPAIDDDGQTITYLFTWVNTSGETVKSAISQDLRFKIVGNKIYVHKPEAVVGGDVTIDYAIVADDGLGLSNSTSTGTVTVVVLDEEGGNYSPPTPTTPDGRPATVDEYADKGTVVVRLPETDTNDPGENQSLSYYFYYDGARHDTSHDGRYKIVGNEIVVNVDNLPVVDSDSDPVDYVIEVDDGQGRANSTSRGTIQIVIEDVNNPPPAPTGDFEIDEGSNVGDLVMVLGATHDGTQPITYYFTWVDSVTGKAVKSNVSQDGLYEIFGNEVRVKEKLPLINGDRPTVSYDIVAQDDPDLPHNSAKGTVTITIKDVNNAPPEPAGSAEIKEDITLETEVLELGPEVDDDTAAGAQPITYLFKWSDNTLHDTSEDGFFQIRNNKVYVIKRPSVTGDAQKTYTVVASDGSDLPQNSSTGTITIDIENVNSPPPDPTPADDITIQEGLIDEVIYTFPEKDEVDDEVLSYVFVWTDETGTHEGKVSHDGRFEIVGNTIVVRNSGDVPPGGLTENYTVVVKDTSNASNDTTTGTVTIVIEDVNTAPAAPSGSREVPSGFEGDVLVFDRVDSDGQTIQYYFVWEENGEVVTSVTSKDGLFYFDGNVLKTVEGADTTVSTDTPLNYDVVADDDADASNSQTPGKIKIVLKAEINGNYSPPDPSKTIDIIEDLLGPIHDFAAMDELDDELLTYYFTWVDGTTGLTVTSDTSQDGRFKIVGNQLIALNTDVDEDFEGTYTVVAQDPSGQSNDKTTGTVVVRISDVNNEPEVIGIADVDGRSVLIEDGPHAGKLLIAEDVGNGLVATLEIEDEDGDDLTLSLRGAYANFFSIDADGQIFLIDGDYDLVVADGDIELIVDINDGTTTVSYSVIIRVTNVQAPGNTLPTVSDVLAIQDRSTQIEDDEDEWVFEISADITDGYVADVEGADGDVGDTLTYAILEEEFKDLFTIEADGKIRLINAALLEAGKEYRLTVRVADGRDSIDKVVVIRVDEETEPPENPTQILYSDNAVWEFPAQQNTFIADLSTDLAGDYVFKIVLTDPTTGEVVRDGSGNPVLVDSDGRFRINGLQLESDTQLGLDFEARPDYVIKLRVMRAGQTDPDDWYLDQDITITLLDMQGEQVLGDDLGNRILAAFGEDSLNGGGGDDTLLGGIGRDELTGGEGNDYFLFDAPMSFGDRDTIMDFVQGQDQIQINGEMFGLGTGKGDLADTRLVIGTAATTNAHRFIYNPANGKLYYDQDGARDGVAAVELFSFDAASRPLTLTVQDFDII